MKITGKGIGYLGFGVLILGIAAFWNGGTAKAGLLDVVPGITSLVGNTVENISDVTEQGGNLLEVTVESTLEVPVNLADGIVDLTPVTNTVNTAVSKTTDLKDGLGVTVEELLSSTVEFIQVVSNSVLDPVLPIKPPLPIELPGTPLEELPGEERPVPEVTSSSSEVNHSVPAIKPDRDTAPAPFLKPRAVRDIGNNDDTLVEPDTRITVAPAQTDVVIPAVHPRQAPVHAVAKEDAPELVAPVISAPVRDKTAASSPIPHPSPWRKGTMPAAVPVVVSNYATNLQTQSSSGSSGSSGPGSCLHAKLFDAILSEMVTLKMNGRRNYAKNSRLLIPKRGNEPPTPPPKFSFFSQANEPMRKRSEALVEGNRESAGPAGGIGFAIRQPGSSSHSAIATLGQLDRKVYDKLGQL